MSKIFDDNMEEHFWDLWINKIDKYSHECEQCKDHDFDLFLIEVLK